MEVTVEYNHNDREFDILFRNNSVSAVIPVSKVEDIYVNVDGKTLCLHAIDFYYDYERIKKILEHIKNHTREIADAMGELEYARIMLYTWHIKNEEVFINKILSSLKYLRKKEMAKMMSYELHDKMVEKGGHYYAYIEHKGRKALIRYLPFPPTIPNRIILIVANRILRVYDYKDLGEAYEKIIQKKYVKDLLDTIGVNNEFINKISSVISEAPVSDNIKEEFMKALNRRLEIEVAKEI